MRICACFGRGNLRGTWNTELCRFLTKSKSIYKNPSRTPYKPLVEIMKIKWNKKIWCSLSVPKKQKSTYENFVSAWFSSSGPQDVSAARWAPSNPLGPFAWYPRKLGEESMCSSGFGTLKPSFAALTSVHCHFCRFESKLSAPEMSMSSPLRGEGLRAYKRKKHSDLLYFLVAGPRIELGTSWLWIMRSNQLSYPAINIFRTLLR